MEVEGHLFDLTGRGVLVTGGGTGLGRHFARVMAKAGARVVLCARRVEKIQQCAEEINNSGGIAEYYQMDVTKVDSVKEAIAAGGRAGVISVVVNNAGVHSEPMLLDMTEEEWDGILATNLKGSWLVAKEAVAQMAEAGVGGSIINIASILGLAAQKGTGPYSASKAALLHLTRNMALEWAKYGVRVNSIAPGYFSTDLADDFIATELGKAMLKRIPQRRLGRHEDLSGPILLLASDASAYMTGTTVTVDGGHSMPVA
ncbi:MAG: SDR family NAD(P)-dependent oxidoreductase [Halieaceae bacterium]|nr:SDR family NAD(P)-dependent oxidoreductase [Halieaceae bacterium]